MGPAYHKGVPLLWVPGISLEGVVLILSPPKVLEKHGQIHLEQP